MPIENRDLLRDIFGPERRNHAVERERHLAGQCTNLIQALECDPIGSEDLIGTQFCEGLAIQSTTDISGRTAGLNSRIRPEFAEPLLAMCRGSLVRE